MNTSTTPTDGLGSPRVAPIRELTSAETDHVSGGIVPIVVAAVVVAAAVVQESCSGDDDSNEQSDD